MNWLGTNYKARWYVSYFVSGLAHCWLQKAQCFLWSAQEWVKAPGNEVIIYTVCSRSFNKSLRLTKWTAMFIYVAMIKCTSIFINHYYSMLLWRISCYLIHCFEIFWNVYKLGLFFKNNFPVLYKIGFLIFVSAALDFVID